MSSAMNTKEELRELNIAMGKPVPRHSDDFSWAWRPNGHAHKRKEDGERYAKARANREKAKQKALDAMMLEGTTPLKKKTEKRKGNYSRYVYTIKLPNGEVYVGNTEELAQKLHCNKDLIVRIYRKGGELTYNRAALPRGTLVTRVDTRA